MPKRSECEDGQPTGDDWNGIVKSRQNKRMAEASNSKEPVMLEILEKSWPGRK